MRSLLTWLRLLPWVIGSSALAIAGLCVVRALVPLALLEPSNDVVGNYLQTLGGIYAVLLAFVVFVVWQQFNDARASVEREASEVDRPVPHRAGPAQRRSATACKRACTSTSARCSTTSGR